MVLQKSAQNAFAVLNKAESAERTEPLLREGMPGRRVEGDEGPC